MLDSPDRHSANTADWLPRLEQLAYDAGRPLAVVAVVSALPDSWDGPAAVIGNSVTHTAPAEPAEPLDNAQEDPEEVPETLQRTAK